MQKTAKYQESPRDRILWDNGTLIARSFGERTYTSSQRRIHINTVALLSKPFDPFPYILLNLVLSCLAAIQAPVIMMSQNRQEA